ncbi:type I-E CRISPR-associated protein Cse1/CasA [Rhodocista pekingensis]|uniref:Type I-E CRISPR-associated protein Cse1/CasA n=1 Tax=Rhodocista pekingensis TaxID=201185 RepID=A0ABW2KXP5_9PROT
MDRRSGPGVATPLELTSRYGDDPILGVRLGHPLADRGFEFLMRDILQAALAPEDATAWRRMLVEPPGPEALAAALAPYRETFRLDHPTHPALQVRPAPERLAEAAAKKPARKPASEAEEDGEEEEAGALPIAALLPDLPTGEAVKKDADFFIRRGSVTAIGAGPILPVLYAHMVLFPPGGGGYLGLPHGADSIKFQLIGRTLWETIWLNVLTRGAEGGGDAVWPARPDDPTAFPWLDPALPGMPLGRKEDGAARPMNRAALHPAHIPMPRRYLLAPPVQGRCDLTGREGPVFTGYSRWPKGLQYQPDGWWFPAMVRIEDAAKPDAPPQFLRARGPLRFDDWLESAMLKDEERAPDRKDRPQGKVRRLPPVLRQFKAGAAGAAELSDGGTRATALMEDGSVRVRVFAQYPFGKAVGGMSQRELPLWHLPAERQSWLGEVVSKDVGRVKEMAGALQISVRAAVTKGRRDGSAALADTLGDALLAAVDGQATEHAAALAALARDIADRAARQAAATESRTDLLKRTGRLALALFDEAFPVDPTGVTDKALTSDDRFSIPAERDRLLGRLGHILKSDD